MPTLVGAAEIARALGLGRRFSVVHYWPGRYPSSSDPVKRLGTFNLWLWQDVTAWAWATERLA